MNSVIPVTPYATARSPSSRQSSALATFGIRRASGFTQPVMRRLVLGKEATVEEASTTVRTHSSYRPNSDAATTQRKIVNLAHSIENKVEKREKFFSLELFPTTSSDREVYESFFSEFNRYTTPLFYALTWHDDSGSDDACLPLEILNGFPNNTLLHVTANNSKKAAVVEILNNALARRRTNIFVLRGDSCSGTGDFTYASELVKFIRNRYYSKFTICVAGYPQMHPESSSKEMDLSCLKEKVDAGANFIITQIIFESKVFVEFVRDCRRYGITVPIIPGIFPIPNFKTLLRMAKLCRVEIPRTLLTELQPIKDNDDAVRVYGIALARKLITEIFSSGTASGFHLFTLNRVSIALDVCRKVLK